ncbi:MAG TPA: hypothetical protein VFH03_04605 [Actinoplanes sp.]|nr:hypothetical protein [Actinoplanes sp.]
MGGAEEFSARRGAADGVAAGPFRHVHRVGRPAQDAPERVGRPADTPTLIVAGQSGTARTASTIRAATADAAGRLAPGSSTPNSSPPSRATVSPSRTAPRTASATACTARSPAA